MFVWALSFLILLPVHGKSFRLWTNDVGESIWGFESNCPKKPYKTNKYIDQHEEWEWLQLAARLHRKNLLKNYYHLNQIQLNKNHPELIRMEENMILIGDIEVQRKKVLRELAEPTCIHLDRLCRENIKEETKKISTKLKLLDATKGELLNQSPLLSNPWFHHFIEDVLKSGFPYEMGDKRFISLLEHAIIDTKEVIEERASDLKKISDQNYFDKRLLDTTLIEEVLMSVITEKNPETEKLFYAQCRLENRLLKNKAMTELRTLALDTAFTLASFGFGSFISYGKNLSRAGLMMRSSPLVLNEMLSSINDMNEISITKKRCKAIEAATFSYEQAGTDLLDCKNVQSDQMVKSLLSAFGSGLIIRRSLLETRINKSFNRLFPRSELRSSEFNNIKDISYNVRDAYEEDEEVKGDEQKIND